MSCFILIHGGAHGGWCWDRLVPELEKLGHRAIAPDLPGMGDDRAPLAQVSMAGWANFVTALARKQREPVILVGHSRGGPVIGEAAELDPEAMLGLVYLTALLIPRGQSVMDMFDVGSAELMKGATLTEDQRATIFDPGSAAAIFYNTASAEDARWAASRLCPDPIAVNLTPSTVTERRWGSIPRAFIECTEDRAMPLPMQRAMQVEWPCDPVITLESDHSPFLSIPGETAAALDRIARAFEGRKASRSRS